jgi:hypothetical protein
LREEFRRAVRFLLLTGTSGPWEARAVALEDKGEDLMKRLLIVVVAAGVFTGAAQAAPPENTTPPTLSGTAREGSTLTATRGSWTNGPTTFTFKWQRCSTDGVGCVDITTANSNRYTLASGDVGRTVRVVVTASNADGRDLAPSAPTDVVASRNGPRNTARPAISGTPLVGEQLEVSNGSWTPAPAGFTYQWQRCDTDGLTCVNVAGATARTYPVRAADAGNRLRARVTARTAAGDRATATSEMTAPVELEETPPVTTNRAPTIRFISLKRIGVRVYARFQVCDDGIGRVTVVQRDTKTGTAAYTRRFTVRTFASCGTFSRNWVPASRFRTSGRHVVTLRAVDTSQRQSGMVSRFLVHR